MRKKFSKHKKKEGKIASLPGFVQPEKKEKKITTSQKSAATHLSVAAAYSLVPTLFLDLCGDFNASVESKSCIKRK